MNMSLNHNLVFSSRGLLDLDFPRFTPRHFLVRGVLLSWQYVGLLRLPYGVEIRLSWASGKRVPTP